jgi:rhodanese-related sulfurtransferase
MDLRWRAAGGPLWCRLSWQVYPQMEINARFVEEVEAMKLPPDTEILCICRSGARSASAASALSKSGFSNVWNVSEGFEGDKDTKGQRGRTNGWKSHGLAVGAELRHDQEDTHQEFAAVGRCHQARTRRA